MLVTGTPAMASGLAYLSSRMIDERYSGQKLNSELSKWLQDVTPPEEPYPIAGCKAVIAPSVPSVVSLAHVKLIFTQDTLVIPTLVLLQPGRTRV
jgi:hypothetical protein